MSEEDGRRKKLGRGLSALLGDQAGAEAYPVLDRTRGPRELPVEALRPSRYQPRQHFDEEQLQQLADSIRERGLLQPILVRRLAGEASAYEIVAGERRWRAAQRARLHQVPVVVKDLSDQEALEVGLVENVQRQDLSAIEEAQGYRRLQDEFGYRQEQLAQSVGKSRSHIANLLRLLALPAEVQRMLEAGEISAGHARALLMAADPLAAARQVVDRGLTVRQAEALVAGARSGAAGGRRPRGPGAGTGGKDANVRALERSLSESLGLQVEVEDRDGQGELRIRYGSLEQLDDVCRRLTAAGPGGPGEEPL